MSEFDRTNQSLPAPGIERAMIFSHSNSRMPKSRAPSPWWQLTPQQRAMLRRLHRDGPMEKPERWEMLTVRSLLARGLLRTRTRPRGRDGDPGMWFLTARAIRLVAQETAVRIPAGAKPDGRETTTRKRLSIDPTEAERPASTPR